jgi:hypothetical protein
VTNQVAIETSFIFTDAETSAALPVHRGRIVALINAHVRSERAIPVAVRLATRMNRPLTLLTANAAPFADALLDRHRQLVSQYPGLQAESVLAESSGAESTVLLRCLHSDDMVVIAADHVSVAGELFEGSVFMNLLRTFPGVVVAVGPKAVIPETSSVLLVCVDDTHDTHDTNDASMRLITEFADVACLTAELIKVIASKTPQHRAVRDDLGHDLGTDVVDSGELHQLAAQWNEARPGSIPATYDVLYGDAVTATERHAIGLVSMGFGPLARIISPSLANNLLHRSPRPLVLLSAPPKQVIHQLGDHA